MQPNYSTSFTVDNTPPQVFAAILNPRGWWSQQIEGDTDKLGAEFNYHYKDVHRASFKITEFVPNAKVVWHVVSNHFNFIQDKTEWVGTDIVFEIIPKGHQTELRFTHVGLVPDYECYDVCSNSWGSYISKSLRDLITTGQGQPNPIEEIVAKARAMSAQNFTTSFTVTQSPEEVFAAVNNVRGWFASDIEGASEQPGDEFTFRYKDEHRSVQKVTELVPGQKVVWQVTDSHLSFVDTKDEWTGTEIIFEIVKKGDRTELQFTHVGLVPAFECYSACSEGWGFCVNQSLFNLISTGTGQPSLTQESSVSDTTL